MINSTQMTFIEQLHHLPLFVDNLLKTQAIPDDTQLTQTLKEWPDFLYSERILDDVQAALARINAEPERDFLHRSLYAKDFYPQVVHPVLARLLGQKSEKERRIGLFKILPMPNDLDFIRHRMGLL